MPIPAESLHEDEEVLVDFRPHWVFFFGPLLLTLVAIGVTLAVIAQFPKAPVGVVWILALMIAIPFLWLAARVVRWLGVSLIVTTERLIVRRGLLGREVRQVRLERIAVVHITQRFVDRLLNKGRLIVGLRGEEARTAIEDVRRPRFVLRTINDQRLATQHPFGVRGPAQHDDPSVARMPSSRTNTPPLGLAPLPGPTPAAGFAPVPGPTPPAGMSFSGSATPAGGLGQGRPSVSEQLIQLYELRHRGILSEKEFNSKKAELLSRF